MRQLRTGLSVLAFTGIVLAGLLAGGRAGAWDLGTPGVTYGPDTHKSENWIEQLMTGVVGYQTLAEKGAMTGDFRPYLARLVEARDAYWSGDQQRTYRLINDYMVMLEAREGGIDSHAAEALWTQCYQVTPARYHARDRHVRAHGADEVRKYEDFVKHMYERPQW